MVSFLTNARSAETGDLLGPDAGLAAADAADGDGAARSEPVGTSSAVNIARVIVSPMHRRNHRHRVLQKDTPSIKGWHRFRPRAAQAETLALSASRFDYRIGSALEQ